MCNIISYTGRFLVYFYLRQPSHTCIFVAGFIMQNVVYNEQQTIIIAE